MKYQETIKGILENIGGETNIESVTHCMTRLSVLTASIVSVSSLWAGERIVSILSGKGFSRLSKSPKIRSGLIPLLN